MDDYKPKGMAKSTRSMWGWDFGRYDKILMVLDDCRFKASQGDYQALPAYFAALDTLKLNWTSFMQKDDKDKYDSYVKMFNINYSKGVRILNNTKRITKYFALAAFWLKRIDDQLMFIKQFKGLGLPIEFKKTESEKLKMYLLNNASNKAALKAPKKETVNYDPKLFNGARK